jgi:hypothetical protein
MFGFRPLDQKHDNILIKQNEKKVGEWLKCKN